MVTMTERSIGGRARDLRERRGLSQKELAHIAHVPQPWLSEVESGATPNPGAVRMQRLADALGVTQAQLITGHSDDDPVDPEAAVNAAMSHLGKLFPPDDLNAFERWIRTLLLRQRSQIDMTGESHAGEDTKDEPKSEGAG